MKKYVLGFIGIVMTLGAYAANFNGQYISTYYNRFYRNCTVSLATSGDSVLVTNLLNCQTTISAYYDSIANALVIPPGQIIFINGSRTYRLYTYTFDENGIVVNDYTSEIIFSITEYSTYTKFASDQKLLVITTDFSSPLGYTEVAFRDWQNAILRTEVVDRENPYLMKRVEEYPVYVGYLGEGKYRIDNFGEYSRLILTTNREQSDFTSIYGSYPAIWESGLQNYFFPCAFEWDGSKYTFSEDLNLYGAVMDNQLQLNRVWNYRCDNRNNFDADSQYRKLYRKDNDMHKNTTITLTDSTMHFMFPHTTHEVTQTELIMTTYDNFLLYNQQGWMWSGDQKNDANAFSITNKRSTIAPGTDSIIDPTYFPGLDIKQSTFAKNIYVRITGVSLLKYYITSNASEQRIAEVVAMAVGDTITKQTSSTSTGAVDTILLNPEQTYDVLFRTADGKDMTLYAIQLINRVDSTITAIDTQRTEPPTIQYFYGIIGQQFTHPQHGINIIRMSDGTTRKIVIL